MNRRSVCSLGRAIGVYGYPPPQAAAIAVETLRSTPTRVRRIALVAFDDATQDVLTAAARS